LDKVANEMVRWANTLPNHTDMMHVIPSDARALRDRTRKLVQQVLKGGQSELVDTCTPLAKLLDERT
jgi:hypothetical protein